VCLAAPAWGAQVLFTAPGTSVTFGHPYGDLEFNNPLAGTETVAGLPVLEWRDAGWECPASPSHEDWTVSNPCVVCPAPVGCIDGYVNEIWLRGSGDAATTMTTVASTVVSVHLHGDDNDGIVNVTVDGVVVASMDMWTAATDNALVLVTGLPSIPHVIDVIDLGASQQAGADPTDDDVALMGAAALQGFDPFWKADHRNYAPSGMPDFDQRQDQWAHEIRCGPNATSDSIAVGDDVQLILPGMPCPGPNAAAVTKGPNRVMETPVSTDDFYIYEYCAPTAVANCLWWFDSKFEQDPTGFQCDGADTYDLVTAYPSATDDHCPDNVDTAGPAGQFELVEDLAMRMDTGGQASGAFRNGTTARDMFDAVTAYLKDRNLHDDYLVRLIREPGYDFLVTELERSQDLILGLSFVQRCQGPPVFVGGHAVTMSGFELPNQNLCLSDPYYNLAETGAPGRVLPPVPHPHGIPETLHNDAAFVSHDCFAATQPPIPPYGVTGLVNYATTSDEGTTCADIANFLGQNSWNPEDPAFSDPVPCDPTCPVETLISFVLEISPFDWKERNLPDYAPNGVPDFDQKQASFVCPLDQSWSFCGPTAVANSMWWFDSVREPNPIPPPVVNDNYPLIFPFGSWDDHDPANVVPLITDLGIGWLNTDGMTGGFPPRPPFCGTYIEDMERGIKDYLVGVGLDAEYYVHRVRAPTFDWVAREIERSQDVILLLGFWQLQDLGVPTWVRIGGHYVTSAGIDRDGGLIAISDPILDRAETVPLGGVVGDGVLLPHVHPPTPPDGTHNDAGNVSHDIYAAVPTDSPGGVWGPGGYSAAIGPFLDNFEGQNTADEFGDDLPTGPPQGNEPIQTEVDFALAVSPCPWLFDQVVARGYCSGNPAQACLVDTDCPAADVPCLNAIFQWPQPLPYEYVSGPFMTPADIGTYGWTVFAANVGNSSLQPPPDPPAGSGIWYLFRAAHCGTWQTAPGEEPDRDLLLP
jgi:hypothetical protein